jgi:hypothetical protein
VCFCSVQTFAYHNNGRRAFLLYRTLHAIQHSSSSPIITYTHLQHLRSSSPSPPTIHHPSYFAPPQPTLVPVHTRVKGGGGAGGCCVFLLGSKLRLSPSPIISSTHHHLLSSPSPIFNISNHHHRHLLQHPSSILFRSSTTHPRPRSHASKGGGGGCCVFLLGSNLNNGR